MIPIIQFIFGALLLYYGAEYLIKSGKLIASKLGAPPILIGITIIAFGTSLPELIVSVYASLSGEASIALGNVIGSNITNIGLIIGLTAIISPINFIFHPTKKDFYLLLLITGLFTIFLYLEILTHFTGGLFILILLGYCTYLYRTHKNEDFIITEPYTWKMGFFFVFGIAALWVGSDLFVMGSVTIAKYFGVSQIAIGTTMVALGTSLPELATSLVAATRHEPEIAVGNIIGSNLFNILAVMGIVLLLNPIVFEFSSILISTVVMVIFTMLFVIILRQYNQISRLVGLFLIIIYGFNFIWMLNISALR